MNFKICRRPRISCGDRRFIDKDQLHYTESASLVYKIALEIIYKNQLLFPEILRYLKLAAIPGHSP